MAPPSQLHDPGVKLRAVAYYKRVQNKCLTAKMFGVSEATVRMWIKCESRLRAQRGRAKKSDDNGSAAYALLEKSMVEFVNRDHKRGVKTQYGKLLEHAAELKKVHRVKGLHVSLKWVTDFVTKQRLRCKCERLKSTPVVSEHVRRQGKQTKGRSTVQKAASASVKRAAKSAKSPNAKVKKVAAKLRTKFSKATDAKRAKTKMAASVLKTVKKQKDLKRTLKNKLGKLKNKTLSKGGKTEEKRKLLPKADRQSSAVGAAKKSLQKAKRSLVRKLADAKPRWRKQPTKIFRTRYRIKEMRKKIEESRASDFFDFFYGLGLVPVSRGSNDAWSLLHETPIYSGHPSTASCNPLSSEESPTSPAGRRRYLAWRPRSGPHVKEEALDGIEVQDIDPSDPGCSGDGGPSCFSLLCQTKTFFDSLQSETAVSPGESPVTPEQLAVAKQLFPPVGRLRFEGSDFSRSDTSLRQKLRPRSSEQLQRLADCFGSRKKHGDAASTPSKADLDGLPKFGAVDLLYETPRKSHGWPEPSRSVLKLSPDCGRDRMLMKRLRDDIESLQPKAKKEHFEEGVNLLLSNVCRSPDAGQPDVDDRPMEGGTSVPHDCFQQHTHR